MRGKGLQSEAAAVQRHKGVKVCARAGQVRRPGTEAGYSLCKPVNPDKECLYTWGKGEPVEMTLWDSGFTRIPWIAM